MRYSPYGMTSPFIRHCTTHLDVTTNMSFSRASLTIVDGGVEFPIITSIFFKLLSSFPWVLTDTDAPIRSKIGFQSWNWRKKISVWKWSNNLMLKSRRRILFSKSNLHIYVIVTVRAKFIIKSFEFESIYVIDWKSCKKLQTTIANSKIESQSNIARSCFKMSRHVKLLS